MERRVITTDMMEEDIRIEGSLRPQCLDDYIGQEKAKKNLKIYISCKTAKRCTGSCIVLRTTRAWKNHTGGDYCQ